MRRPFDNWKAGKHFHTVEDDPYLRKTQEKSKMTALTEQAYTAIHNAIVAVENLPAHRHLTDAVIALGKAKQKVYDFAHNVPEPERRVIYKFAVDCGRMGDLESVFVATPAEIESRLGAMIGFGEVLGKHSDVCITLKREHLKEITDCPEIIDFFELNDMESGNNPLNYSYKPEGADDWIDV
jgi:hypothetical protein